MYIVDSTNLYYYLFYFTYICFSKMKGESITCLMRWFPYPYHVKTALETPIYYTTYIPYVYVNVQVYMYGFVFTRVNNHV